VYSTCSIHAIENEHVVQAALDSKEVKGGYFTLAPQNEVLPTWQRRGLADGLRDSSKYRELRIISPLNLFHQAMQPRLFVACRGKITLTDSS
jgi:16S rRNA C967 or C1407 C5-methylase (RsmB/RsmF family)